MRKRGLRHYNMPVFLILLLVSVVMIFPFIWMVLSAFKTNADVNAYPIRWLPSSFEWSNFQKVFQMVPFLRYYWNTILTSVLQTLLQIAMSIGEAYERTVQFVAGQQTGEAHLIVVSEPAAALQELTRSNNQRLAGFDIRPAYRATVSAAARSLMNQLPVGIIAASPER